jgi:hypothetical protein
MPGKKKTKHSTLVNAINRLSRSFRPDQILAELSNVYEEYSASSTTEAEVDYWLKCSRACRNLSSGTEKWLYEIGDDEEEEDEEE